MLQAAKMEGATVMEDTPVTRILTEDGKVVGVDTADGVVECEYAPTLLLFCCSETSFSSHPLLVSHEANCVCPREIALQKGPTHVVGNKHDCFMAMPMWADLM
jgi:phytoene dehydrogenase-like protein